MSFGALHYVLKARCRIFDSVDHLGGSFTRAVASGGAAWIFAGLLVSFEAEQFVQRTSGHLIFYVLHSGGRGIRRGGWEPSRNRVLEDFE